MTSSILSIFCPTVMPKDLTVKDLTGTTDADQTVVKSLSLRLTSVVSPILLGLTWAAYLATAPGWLNINQDILFTRSKQESVTFL